MIAVPEKSLSQRNGSYTERCVNMKEYIVTMRWADPKWLMEMGGFFIFDFWNCGTVNKVFPHLNKEIPQKYKITVEYIRDD
jgi:hypothetical protein